MSRLTIPTIEQTPANSLPLLDAVKKQLGVVPNLMKFKRCFKQRHYRWTNG